MEVGNQHFSIEKQEKFKYIDELRKTCNKDLLKMHKIKGIHVKYCSSEAKIKQKQNFSKIDLQRDSYKSFWRI